MNLNNINSTLKITPTHPLSNLLLSLCPSLTLSSGSLEWSISERDWVSGVGCLLLGEVWLPCPSLPLPLASWSCSFKLLISSSRGITTDFSISASACACIKVSKHDTLNHNSTCTSSFCWVLYLLNQFNSESKSNDNISDNQSWLEHSATQLQTKLVNYKSSFHFLLDENQYVYFKDRLLSN